LQEIEEEEDFAEEAVQAIKKAEELQEDLEHCLETNELDEANRILDDLRDLENKVRSLFASQKGSFGWAFIPTLR